MSRGPAPVASADLFRDLMAGFASGVTIATALDSAGQPHGMTASAVAGLSLEPPLVLLCVERTADLHPVLCEAESFALSVLAADQEWLSRRFADSHPDRFAGVPWTAGLDRLPLIEGALAHITCRKWGQYWGGDHTIFVGQVSDGRVFDCKPLIHFHRGYGTIK
ncbi:MAG: flavin reductase family protein [Gemmatimonadetes bacterium]|nr:flavin reductase family protein [Gemmatimonadota bacterium]